MPPKYSKCTPGLSQKLLITTSKSPVKHGNKKGTKKKVLKKKNLNGTQKKGKVKKKIIPICQRVNGRIENLIVVWLDSNINLLDKDYQNSIKHLQRIINSIQIFTEKNQCEQFLKEIQDEKIFLIVSGFLGEQILPKIENLLNLNSIYVFCSNRPKHLTWASKYNKIKGVFTDITTLCQLLKNDIQPCENNLIAFSILSRDDDFNKNDLNSLDSSFMYSKLLKEILLEIENNDQEKENLIEFCRIQYQDNEKELKILNEFNKNYTPSLAIRWYTRECFTYTMLNKALRTQDIEIIIKMGFFIRDLHLQIQHLHQYQDHQRLLTVYRGQGMSPAEFDKLTNCQGGLLSFNSFLSTSIEQEIAFKFALQAQKDSNLVAILFQMKINPLLSSTPFAAIGDHSYYLDKEKEILFSMHTVFRIGEMKKLKEGIWKVYLILTDDNDEQLQNLTDHIRRETRGSTGWHRLGSLMIAMGQFDKAEEFYKLAYNMTSADNWKELAHFHCQLGYIHDERNDPETALIHYEEALDIQLANLSGDDPNLSITYTGIGSVLHSQYDFDGALEHFQYALHLALQNPNPDLLQIATIYNYIGGTYNELNQYVEALDSYQQSLSFRNEHLPPLHPLLATTYNNIGVVHQSTNDYSKAFYYYEKTLEIEQKSLPSNHPSLAVTYHNMAWVLECLHRYQEAIQYQTRSLEILRIAYGSDHPQVQSEENDLQRLRGKL